MANASKESVIRIDTTAQVQIGPCRISSIKFMPGTGSPSAQIRCDGVVGGMILWESVATAEVHNHVCIHSRSDLYIAIAGTGSVLYIYLE